MSKGASDGAVAFVFSYPSGVEGGNMLKPVPFATSLAVISGALYLVLSILAFVWPQGFRFLFNAQFFGADVASLLPRDPSYAGFLGTLIAVVVGVWVVAYAWAWLYNRLAR